MWDIKAYYVFIIKNRSTKSQIVNALFFKLKHTNLGTSYNSQLSMVTPHNKNGGMALNDSAHNNQLVDNASVLFNYFN
jgi:hypothetical protein